jgi:exodeoxyribonuclease VII small subunit
MTEPEIGYADAMRELETILDRLDDDQLDIDVLASNVERASELIKLCRDRIGSAKVQVETVVASMQADLGDHDDDPDDGLTLDLDQ